MGKTVSLTKILSLREREKKDAQLAHHESMMSFEEVATKLYKLLKRKEDAEDSYEGFLQNTVPINKIKEQATYIELLNKQIMDLQTRVMEARTKMETKQVKLTDAHVEVKKFEKVIENRENERAEKNLKLEQQEMDEISIQQFLSQKNR